MLRSILILLVSCSVVLGSYYDQNGNNKLGEPKPGEKYREKKDGPLLEMPDPKKEQDALQKVIDDGMLQVEKFSKDLVHPKRVIDGKPVDLSDAIKWAKQEIFFHYLGAWTERSPDFKEKYEKHQALKDSLSQFYIPGGKVQQVVQDGVIMTRGDAWFIVKNYPFAVVDDQTVNRFLAVPAGRYQYITVLGATKTIRAYDYGRLPENESKSNSP
jgi:hypothetical protein